MPADHLVDDPGSVTKPVPPLLGQACGHSLADDRTGRADDVFADKIVKPLPLGQHRVSVLTEHGHPRADRLHEKGQQFLQRDGFAQVLMYGGDNGLHLGGKVLDAGVDVHAHADKHPWRLPIARRHHTFTENTRDLAAVEIQVVGPFDQGCQPCYGLEGLAAGQSGGQGDQRQTAHGKIGRENQGEIEPAHGGAEHPAVLSPAGELALRQHHRTDGAPVENEFAGQTVGRVKVRVRENHGGSTTGELGRGNKKAETRNGSLPERTAREKEVIFLVLDTVRTGVHGGGPGRTRTSVRPRSPGHWPPS